jgi:DNA-binding winged helix-turn-helix (wHTH) protein
VVRYRFNHFVVSPGRRVLAKNGRELALIPRYFDLLVLLIERRHEAVHKRDIFDRVWSDVIVSDSALSQAVRTIRRTLEDDPREPRFIRTVSRHGYQFVFADVIEEEDDGELPAASAAVETAADEGAQAVTVTPMSVFISALASAAATGAIAGSLGGLTLAAIPDSRATLDLVPVLAAIGAASAALGGAGVAAGLIVPMARAGGIRIAAASAGGAFVGLTVQLLAGWSLAALVGVRVAVGGGLEGLVLGAAAGAGCVTAASLFRGDGSRRTRRRFYAAALTALICGVAGAALSISGRPLVGGTVHSIAQAARGSRITLAPLGRLIGEPDFGPITRGIVGFSEAAFFGFGFAFGYTRRTISPSSDERFIAN